MVMNNSLWTTYSQSLNNFEFSHFCRFFPILFDSYRHSLLNCCVALAGEWNIKLVMNYKLTTVANWEKLTIILAPTKG